MAIITVDLDDHQMDRIVIESLKYTIAELLDDASPLHEFDAAVRKDQAESFIDVLRYYQGDELTETFLRSLGE